jgi:hypothetical protein
MPPRSFRIFIRLLAITVLAVPVALRAQSTLIPVTTRRAIVFDHAGNYLYISTSDGFVKRYNIASNQIDASYSVGRERAVKPRD